jgi:hypothetical protein
LPPSIYYFNSGNFLQDPKVSAALPVVRRGRQPRTE